MQSGHIVAQKAHPMQESSSIRTMPPAPIMASMLLREWKLGGRARCASLAGRGAPEELIALADYVSVIEARKHPFADGARTAAREGVEY